MTVNGNSTYSSLVAATTKTSAAQQGLAQATASAKPDVTSPSVNPARSRSKFDQQAMEAAKAKLEATDPQLAQKIDDFRKQFADLRDNGASKRELFSAVKQDFASLTDAEKSELGSVLGKRAGDQNRDVTFPALNNTKPALANPKDKTNMLSDGLYPTSPTASGNFGVQLDPNPFADRTSPDAAGAKPNNGTNMSGDGVSATSATASGNFGVQSDPNPFADRNSSDAAGTKPNNGTNMLADGLNPTGPTPVGDFGIQDDPNPFANGNSSDVAGSKSTHHGHHRTHASGASRTPQTPTSPSLRDSSGLFQAKATSMYTQAQSVWEQLGATPTAALAF